MNQLKVEARGEREIVMTRDFDAPRQLVFDAFTKPDLLKRWMYGPEGWTFAVCEIDLRVGGRYRFVWQGHGTEMGLGGIYREIVAPVRIVSTERFDEAWYPGEATGTVVLTERAGTTTLTQTLQYESRAARDGMLKSPMESGVTASYDRLEKLMASMARIEK